MVSVVAVAWLEQLSTECWKRKLGRLKTETGLSLSWPVSVSERTLEMSASAPLSVLVPGRLPKLTEACREAEPGSQRLRGGSYSDSSPVSRRLQLVSIGWRGELSMTIPYLTGTEITSLQV